MTHLKAVIVEDEKHSRETLRQLLTEFIKDVSVCAAAENVDMAIETIRNCQPDIVFLDIELQSGTGFDVLNGLKDMQFEVIFTTAFEHYAIKAIKFSSIDYLLKPIDLDDLQLAVDKVREKRNSNPLNRQIELLLANLNTKESPKRICLSTSEGFEFINVDDIISCEAGGSYTTFYLVDGRNILVSKNLKEYEIMLPADKFLRVHNSYLINLLQVKKFIKSEGGYILMNNDQQVSISQKKREEFLLKMNL